MKCKYQLREPHLWLVSRGGYEVVNLKLQTWIMDPANCESCIMVWMIIKQSKDSLLLSIRRFLFQDVLWQSCLPLTSLHLARTSHHKIWHSEHFLSTSDIPSLRIAFRVMPNVTIFCAYNAPSSFGSYIYLVGICHFFVVVGRCFSIVSHICFRSFHQLVLNSELTNPLLFDTGLSNQSGCKTHKDLVYEDPIVFQKLVTSVLISPNLLPLIQ